MGGVLSRHGVQYLKYHQIRRHSQKPQNSQEQHIYLEAAGGWYRDPLHQWLPPRPVELYWVCAVTVHTWLWPRVSVITAEFSSCLSFRSLWVFFCLPPSWCWSLKARQKCLMYLSLKTSTSSHGIMGIRAQPAVKMPCLWLVSDYQSFVSCGLSVYRSIILRSEEKVISWKCWGWTLKKQAFDPWFGYELKWLLKSHFICPGCYFCSGHNEKILSNLTKLWEQFNYLSVTQVF